MLGNNKLEKHHNIKLTFLLFVLGFRDLQEGVKDRCATITPRDSGERFCKVEPAVLRVFFVSRHGVFFFHHEGLEGHEALLSVVPKGQNAIARGNAPGTDKQNNPALYC